MKEMCISGWCPEPRVRAAPCWNTEPCGAAAAAGRMYRCGGLVSRVTQSSRAADCVRRSGGAAGEH